MSKYLKSSVHFIVVEYFHDLTYVQSGFHNARQKTKSFYPGNPKSEKNSNIKYKKKHMHNFASAV